MASDSAGKLAELLAKKKAARAERPSSAHPSNARPQYPAASQSASHYEGLYRHELSHLQDIALLKALNFLTVPLIYRWILSDFQMMMILWGMSRIKCRIFPLRLTSHRAPMIFLGN
jgi:hypothetical protein